MAQIYSDQDREHQREEERLMQLQQQLKERTWAKTLKRQKEVLVSLFVQELREKNSLSKESAQKLEDLIKDLPVVFRYLQEVWVVHYNERFEFSLAYVEKL